MSTQCLPHAAERSASAAIRAWAGGAPLSRRAALLFGLALPAILLAASLWRVHPFTVDDSFISYRYARNFANGVGLVYNPGERVEGYTNFLWTVLLSGGIKLGIDPERLSKVMGAASAFGSLALVYAIAGRLRPFKTLPCMATWLLASSVVFTGWPVFGLETGLFVSLVLAGTLLFLRESPEGEPAPRALPWSGLAFALAGLTRPEAPMFIGLLMLVLGRGMLTKQNLLRGALFLAPLLAHLTFRRLYYGAWLPNTFVAKTGGSGAQIARGLDYVRAYFASAGPVWCIALVGLGMGIASRRRDLAALAAVALGVLIYVVAVGGDWMKLHRFMAPFEPFCFLLADAGVRRTVERRDLATNVAAAAFALIVAGQRGASLREAQSEILHFEKRNWDAATLGVAGWLLDNGRSGTIALADIGYIGWATDYPVLDLYGLVDPVISKLPGGHTEKVGPGFLERVFGRDPDYIVLFAATDCQRSGVPTSQVILEDALFRERYRLGARVPVDADRAFCVYERKGGS